VDKLSWNQIRKRYKDQWVVMDDWDENEYGDVLAGHVSIHSADRKEISEEMKRKYKKMHLAIRYTGNVEGPFFLP